MSAARPASASWRARSGAATSKKSAPRSGSRTCAASPRSAERLPPQELVDLLNRYFDCQVPTILEHGGEVLKFIGDGLLAIFPLAETAMTRGEVCQRALSCALRGGGRIDALDAPVRREQGRDPLRAGAPRRPGDVRQHRRRQPARLHLHRPGGEPRRAAGEARGRSSARRSWRRRNSPRMCRGSSSRSASSRGGFRRAAGGVRLDRTGAMTEPDRS